MAQKPSIPKGTRDFSPIEVAKRNYIIHIIKESFELFGFQPIETPSFEKSETLMGKYGEEGDRLIFKILNSGDYLGKVDESFYLNVFRIKNKINEGFDELDKYIKTIDSYKSNLSNNYEAFRDKLINEFNFFYDEDFELYNFSKKYIVSKLIKIFYECNFGTNKELASGRNGFLIKEIIQNYIKKYSNKITPKISEKALRYDLTVPFARYVVQHQNEITLPFKRYQIQPVWRADRPQKGRFREFYQCDADVVGSTSLIQEVEFVQLYDAVFTKLGLTETIIKVNNRKVLSGIAEIIGAKDKLIDFTVALDKLDKIGADGVIKEMLSKGIPEDAIKKVQSLFSFTGSNNEKINQLKEMLQTSEEGLQGVSELQFIIDNIERVGLKSAILDIDVTLARGLNYYTGAIYEVVTNKVNIGSIGGGGRYDDLTSIFGLKDLSGIGISFGLDRIYIVLEELGLFKDLTLPKPKVLFLNYNEENIPNRLKALTTLRNNGISAEIYPDTATSNKKQQKQFKYLQKRTIEFVILDNEIGNELSLKNTKTGEIVIGDIQKIVSILK